MGMGLQGYGGCALIRPSLVLGGDTQMRNYSLV